jgi:hypothetical protein
MHKVTGIFILICLLLGGIIGFAIFKFRTDKTAWEQVQSNLVRLRSGIQFESVVALRSHLADADAAIKLYGSGWRVYPPEHEKRIRDAETALGYLSSALEWQTRSVTTETYVGPTAVYEVGLMPNEVTSRFQRSCTGSEISFSATAAASAFGAAAILSLEHAQYPMPRTFSVVETFAQASVEREESECRRQETARTENLARIGAEKAARTEADRRNQARVAAEKVAKTEADRKTFWSKWRVHVELQLLASNDDCRGEVYADGQTLPLHLWGDESWSRDQFVANETMKIVVACRSDRYSDRGPKDEIQVKINDLLYKPQWENDQKDQEGDYRNKYSATILPLRQ